MIPTTDAELFDWIAANLYTAVLSDSCDSLGFRRQAMGPEMRPVDEGVVLVGRARTTFWAESFHVAENPYEGEMRAIDSLNPGDVAVMATGRSEQIATYGELMCTAAKMRGGCGLLTDGLIGDVRRLRELGLPCFAAGYR